MSNDPRVNKGRKTARPVPPPVSAAFVVKVHPDVWRAAMKLASGKRSRITVLTATKVEVR